ncbi:MAG: hypothetical protein Q9204_007893 [Flavoplaca sp. TL-2023a]
MEQKRESRVHAPPNNVDGRPPTCPVSAVRIISERKLHENYHPDTSEQTDDVTNANQTSDPGANRPIQSRSQALQGSGDRSIKGNTNRLIDRPVLKDHEAPQQPSTSIPSQHTMTGTLEDTLTVRLDDTPMTIIGQYQIWVRKGAVSVLGATLHPSSAAYRVFAPSTHSLPVIRPIWNPFGPAEQPVEITIVSFRSGIRLLKQVSPHFGRIWSTAINVSGDITNEANGTEPRVKRTYSILNTPSVSYVSKGPLNPLDLPTGWQPLLTSLTSRNLRKPPTIALVCGPKGSGKSSFVRMLSNGSIDARGARFMALLDIDPGQPEFSPPGEVSLVQISSFHFGPPYCHPSTSGQGLTRIRSHHIGATSPRDDPQHYLQCILELFQHYKQLLAQHPSCPLVVNTAGWIQGKGLELLFDLIQQLNLTDVIYTSTAGPSEVVDAITQATEGCSTRLHLIPSQPVEAPPRDATELRMMQTLSYFHLDEPEMGHLRWDATPIQEMATEHIHYAGPEQSIYAVQLLGPELDPEFLIQVLEGCVVGLVVVENHAALNFDPLLPLPRTSEQIPYIPSSAQTTAPLSPFHSYSLGQGLIRSIDTISHTFNLVTPIPHSIFASLCTQQSKLVLVRGSLDTPAWAYKEDLYKQMYRRKQIVKEGIADEGMQKWTREDTKNWADGRPWMHAGGRRDGERPKRLRRDLK